jgi:hypothetical protein
MGGRGEGGGAEHVQVKRGGGGGNGVGYYFLSRQSTQISRSVNNVIITMV